MIRSIRRKLEKSLEIERSLAIVEPFHRDARGQLFLKFDRIDVDLQRSQLVFYWRGKKTVTQTLDNIVTMADAVTIGGIEGKTKISVTTS